MTNKIPASQAEFFWNKAPGQRPESFTVANRGERMAELDRTGHDPMHRLGCSSGAHCDDWLQPGGNTPEAMFASMFLTYLPRPHHDAVVAGLRQFVMIDGQAWAERMLEQLDRDGGRYVEEDPKPPFEGILHRAGRSDYTMLLSIADELSEGQESLLARLIGMLGDDEVQDIRTYMATIDLSPGGHLIAKAIGFVEQYPFVKNHGEART